MHSGKVGHNIHDYPGQWVYRNTAVADWRLGRRSRVTQVAMATVRVTFDAHCHAVFVCTLFCQTTMSRKSWGPVLITGFLVILHTHFVCWAWAFKRSHWLFTVFPGDVRVTNITLQAFADANSFEPEQPNRCKRQTRLKFPHHFEGFVHKLSRWLFFYKVISRKIAKCSVPTRVASPWQ